MHRYMQGTENKYNQNTPRALDYKAMLNWIEAKKPFVNCNILHYP
jgi:hypothetical protein